jgi:hypothetical protein
MAALMPLAGKTSLNRQRVVLGNRLPALNVLHLNVETTRGRITRSLNTSDDAKAIERAKPMVAKAVDDGRIRPNSLALLNPSSVNGASRTWQSKTASGHRACRLVAPRCPHSSGLRCPLAMTYSSCCASVQ